MASTKPGGGGFTGWVSDTWDSLGDHIGGMNVGGNNTDGRNPVSGGSPHRGMPAPRPVAPPLRVQPAIRPSSPGVTMGDWQNAYDSYLANAQSQNAGAWAQSQARLAALLDEKNQKQIAANYAGLGSGVDSRLAQELLANMRGANASSIEGLNDRDQMAVRYNELIKSGFKFDEALLSKQDQFLLQQLELDRLNTETARREGRDLNTENLENIASSSAASGTYFSSGRNLMDERENKMLSRLMEKAGLADKQSRKEYDAALAQLGREKQRAKDGMTNADLDLIAKVQDSNRGREQIQFQQQEAEARARAAEEQRQLDARYRAEQLAAYNQSVAAQQAAEWYAELTRQRDAANAAQWYATQAAGIPQAPPRRAAPANHPLANWSGLWG